MNSLDFSRYVFGSPYFAWLCRGFMMTLIITALCAFGGTLFGVIALHGRISAGRPARAAAAGYIVIFRNLPVVPLLLFMTFALPGIYRQTTGGDLPRGFEFSFLILGLSLNAGAYIAEILRAGVESVPYTQVEAARTLGLSRNSIRRRVIFPQAARIVAPALASRCIHIMKNASLALVIPLAPSTMEMVGQAGRIAGQTFSWIEPLIFAAAGYMTLSLILSRLLNRWAGREHARIGAGL